MKKVLSVLLAVVIACSVFVLMTSAAETDYSVTNYTLEEINADGNLRAIGETKAEYVVAKFNGDSTEVVITKNGEESDGIVSKRINFSSVDLENVIIGNGVEYCASLLCGSTNIKNFNVSVDNEYYTSVDGVLFSKDMTELVQYPNGKNVASYAVPEGVTAVSDYAFAECVALEEVVLPSSLRSIGEDSFKKCTSLKKIVLPEGLTSIDDNAFVECTSLTSVIVPSTLENVGWQIFEDCMAITDISINDGCTAIRDTAIKDTAFYNDESNWEDGVLYAGNCLIDADENISGSYTIKPGTTTISEKAFSMCFTLVSVVIPEGVTEIGDYAFEGCVSLEDVVIAEGVNAIKSSAFSGCEEILCVTIPKSVTFIEDGTFGDSNNITVYGYEGSYAETWANERGIPFVVISTEPTVGDVNGDGKVSAVDARLILQYVAGLQDFDESQKMLADVNYDSKIGAIDARCILQIVAGIK